MKGTSQHVLLVSEDREFSQTLEELLHSNGGESYEFTCIFPLEKALDKGWEIFAECFMPEETGMRSELLKKFWPGKEDK